MYQFGLSELGGRGLGTLMCGDTDELENQYWFIITPVCLVPTSNDLVMRDLTDIVASESEELFSLVRDHLKGEYSNMVMHSKKIWCVKTKLPQDLKTTSYHAIRNKSIAPHAITGKDSGKWRRLMSEIEILMSQHHINSQRQLSGKLPINSVWLWGAGSAPSTARCDYTISTRNQMHINLAKLSGSYLYSQNMKFAQLTSEELSNPIIIDINNLFFDDLSWTKKFEDLYLQDAQELLTTKKIRSIKLIVRFNNKVYELHFKKNSSWKLWKFLQKPKILI